MVVLKKSFSILLLLLIFTAGQAWARGGPRPSLLIGAAQADGGAVIVGASSAAPKAVAVQTDDADFAAQVVELINQARWENGRLPPLKRQEGLDAAAADHSQDMALDDYFAHDSYNRVNGQLVFERSWDERVSSYYSDNWSALGECIAAGFTSPSAVIDAWLNSPPHRAILLGEAFTEIGSGYYSGAGTYGTYWTTDYGSRWGVYPLVINREAITTAQRDVSLYVYGAGWATRMRFRNETGEWTEWEPYSPDKAWTLSCGNGQKTVTVELTDGVEVRPASDTILMEGEEYRLAVDSAEVVFLHDMSTGLTAPAATWTVRVRNGGTGCGEITWEAHWDENWLAVSPVTGTTPATLTVAFTPPGEPGEYLGEVTLTTLQPADAGIASQTVAIHLIVAPQIERTFLPMVVKDR